MRNHSIPFDDNGIVRLATKQGKPEKPRKDLDKYTLVDDFMDMVRVFENDELNEFYYTRTNEDWNVQLL
mgnify:CR=1 FL=1